MSPPPAPTAISITTSTAAASAQSTEQSATTSATQTPIRLKFSFTPTETVLTVTLPHGVLPLPTSSPTHATSQSSGTQRVTVTPKAPAQGNASGFNRLDELRTLVAMLAMGMLA